MKKTPEMRFLVLLLTIASELLMASSYSVPGQSPTPAPSVSPVATPSPSVSPPSLEEQLKSAQLDNQKQIKALADKIASLESAMKTGTLDSKVASLTEKVDALEKINKLKDQSQIINDEAKYRAGLETLNVMLGDVEKLDFTNELATSIDNFQRITNPTNNPTFITEINAVKGNKLFKDNPDISIGNSLLSNPYISLAWSIGSVLVSKFSKKETPVKVDNLMCILDVATRTDGDLKIIRSDLSNLGERMRKFKGENEQLFQNYTAAVGNRMTWDQYKTNGGGVDPMDSNITAFFLKFRGDAAAPSTNSNDLTNARFQIENVKASLAEYDGILKQMNDFLVKFSDILGVQRGTIPECPAIPTLKQDFDALKKTSDDLRPKFENAYKYDVKASWRSILYVVN